MDQRAIVDAAMILHPCAVRGVSVKVTGAHFVMLPADHSPQPRKEALSVIGANAIVHEGEAMVDPLVRIPAVQAIPITTEPG
jgi:hypothetical protein